MAKLIVHYLCVITFFIYANPLLANNKNSEALFDAINQGDLPRIISIAPSKSLLELKGGEGITPLHASIVKNKPDITLWLIEQGVVLSDEFVFQENTMPLIMATAIMIPDNNVLQALLDRGLHFNVTFNNLSILHVLASIAQTQPHLDTMQFILDNGFSVAGKTPGFSPLHMAIQQNKIAAATLLIKAGADKERVVNLPGNMLDKLTPLAIATFSNNDEMIQLLIEEQVNVNAQVGYGNNALYYLSFANKGAPELSSVKRLIDAGSDISELTIKNLAPSSKAYEYLSKVNAKKSKRTDALFQAIQDGELGVLEKGNFTQHELNVDYPKYKQPLHYAIKNNKAEVVTWLISNGADLNAVQDYESVAAAALSSGHPEVVLMLVKAGVEFNDFWKVDWPTRGYTEALNAYLDEFPKWKFDAESYDAKDSLLLLINEQKLELLTRLVERGADFSKIQDFKYPLNVAINLNNVALVKLVAQHIPVIPPSASSYNHALILALDKGNKDIVKVLIDQGWQLPAFISNENMLAWLKSDADYYIKLLCQQQSIDFSSRLETAQILDNLTPLINYCGFTLSKGSKSYELLSSALDRNNTTVAGLLVSIGADVNFTPEYSYTHLSMAVKTNKEQNIIYLLEHGAKLSAVGTSELAILVKQYFNDMPDNKVFSLVKKQLDSGPDNTASELKFSELVMQERDEQLFEFVIKHKLLTIEILKPYCMRQMDNWDIRIFCYKTSVLDEGDSQIYALFASVLKGSRYQTPEENLTYFKDIVSSGIDINRAIPAAFGKDKPAIIQAANQGKLDKVQILLGAGAKANIRINDETALTAAAENGNLELIQLLFPANQAILKDINQQQKLLYDLASPYSKQDNIQQRFQAVTWLINQGMTPTSDLIISASKHGQFEFIAWLHGENPQLFTKVETMQRALSVAVSPYLQFLTTSESDQRYLRTLNLLKDYGADPKGSFKSIGFLSSTINSYIAAALTKGSVSLVEWLLTNDSNVPYDFKGFGESVLLMAEQKNANTLHKLFSLGANPDARLANGQTLLIHAVTHNDQPLLSLLLKHSVDVNLGSNEFPSIFPLWQAITNNNIAMVTLLINAGANVNQKQQSVLGESALMLAVDLQSFDMAKLLIAHGANPLAKDKKGASVKERLIAVNNNEMNALFDGIKVDAVLTPMTLHVNRMQSSLKKLDVNKNGSLALYSGSDGKKVYLELWDEINQRAIRTLYSSDSYKDLLIATFIANNRVIAGAYLENIEVIDITSGAIIYNTDRAYQAVVSADKTLLAYSNSDKTTLIDLKTLTVKSTWQVEINQGLQFTDDGNTVLGIDGNQRVVKLKEGMKSPLLFDFYSQRHLIKPNQIELIDSSNFLIASDEFNTIWRWNSEAKQVEGHYIQPENKVNMLASSPDKSHFITLAENYLYIWNLGETKPIHAIEIKEIFSDYTTPKQILFVDDEQLLLIGGRQVIKLSLSNYAMKKHQIDAKHTILKAFLLNEQSLTLLTRSEIINLDIDGFNETARTSSDEVILSGDATNQDNFVVVTQDNLIRQYNKQLKELDKKIFLAEEDDIEQCIERGSVDLRFEQDTMLFKCSQLYRFDLTSHVIDKFTLSGGFWNDFTATNSTVFMISSSYSNEGIRAFELNNPSAKPEVLVGKLNAGTVEYAPPITTYNGGYIIENSNYDIEVSAPIDSSEPLKLTSELSLSSDRLMISQNGNWLVRQRYNDVEIWDLSKKSLLRKIRHPVEITAIALGLSNHSLFIGDENGVLSHIDFLSGEIRYQTPYQQLPISSITLSPDHQQLITTAKSVQVREIATGDIIKDIHQSGWNAVKVFYRGRDELAIEYYQRKNDFERVTSIMTYDLVTDKFTDVVNGQKIKSVSPSGEFVVIEQVNGKYSKINNSTGNRVTFSYPVDDGYRSNQFSISDKGVVYVSHLTYAEKIELAAEKSITLISGHKQQIKSELTFSDDLAWGVYRPKPNEYIWFDTFNNKQLGCVNVGDVASEVIGSIVQIDPQSLKLVLTSDDGIQHQFDAQGGSCSQPIVTGASSNESYVKIGPAGLTINEPSPTGISSLAVLDERHKKVAMAKDNQVRILSLETSQVIGPFETDTLIWGMRFSGDGSLLALSTTQNRLVLLDAESGIEVFNADITFDNIKEIKFSSDNSDLTIVSTMPTTKSEKCKTSRVGTFCQDVINEVSESTQRWQIATNQLVFNKTETHPWQENPKKLSKVDREGKRLELLLTTPYQAIGWRDRGRVTSDNGDYIAATESDELLIWADKLKPVHTIKRDTFYGAYVAFVNEDKFVMVVEQSGDINFYQTKTGEKALTFSLNNDESWLVRDQQGHYDSQDPGDVKYAAWISDNDPLEALPIEVFIADFFEPRLLAKVLSDETNFASRQVTNLNRVRPTVKIKAAVANTDTDTISVSVLVKEQSKTHTTDGKTKTIYSGVNGVALFRNGRQIAFQPTVFSSQDAELSSKEITFDNIQLPSRKVGESIEFSAYAFNDDNVKSLTDVYSFSVADNKEYQTTAYIVSVGINEFQNEAWNLDYAVEDAEALNNSLFSALNDSSNFDRVVNIKLTSKQSAAKPSKELLQVVFSGLTGQAITQKYLDLLPALKKVKRVRPNDTLIFTYAGHGYADPSGDFHLFPWDLAASDGRSLNSALLDSTINSSEFESMLRDVDSDQFVMIIDACNSAASVEGRSFRPGPMGSSGLGQLAYNKKMMILTASQAEEFAIESDRLKHGLLTFSLVEEGLKGLKADNLPKDSRLFAKEWFRYALNRVPDLYREILKDDIVSTDNRGIKIVPVKAKTKQKIKAKVKAKEATQKPGLFDFWRQQDMVIKNQSTIVN